MCRFRAYITSLFLFISMIPAAFALEKSVHRTIRVGFFAFDGYHEIAADGKRSGYGYDFLQKLAQYTGWTYEYIGYDKSWQEMQQMLSEGKIDILTSAQKTPERAAAFAFSEKPIGRSAVILTVRSGNERFIPGDYRTYNGMQVGLLKGSSRNEDLVSFAQKNHFTYIPVYFDDLSSMTDALHHSYSVDALLTSNLRAIRDEWILDQFDFSDFYVMVRKSDTSLLEKVNAAVEEMDNDEPQWRQNLWEQYYKAESGEEIAFSAGERAFIQKAKDEKTVFTVIVDPDRAPYSYFENGVPAGIIPEIFKEITQRTGLDFTIIETRNRKEYFKKLSENNIDVRMDAYYNYYDAERMGYKLTDPYITTNISRITKKSFSGTPKSVAALRYADHTEPYEQIISSTGNTQYFGSTEECIQAVISGKADAAYIYTFIAQRVMNEDVQGQLTSVIYPQYQVSFSAGVFDHCDIRLLTILNKSVRSINKNYIEQIITARTEKQHRPLSLKEYISSNPAVLFMLYGTAALFVFLLIVFAMRQRHMYVLEQKNNALAQAIKTAEQANKAKSAFLSRMSHELRTPMNAIVGISAIAKEHTREPEKIRDYLEKMDSSSRILLEIINDVLDMSAIENGRITLVNKAFSMHQLLDAIGTVYDVQCRKKGISFLQPIRIQTDIVCGDRLRVNQVLLNLVSNAFKFTESGGTVILAAEELPAGNGQVVIRFSVSDTGCGMSDEMMLRLFQPFEQESAVMAQKYGGSGLGLAIAKNLVDLMSGNISVKSKKGIGSTFTVDIPFTPGTPDDIEADSESQDKKVTYDFTGYRFLLAEDNEMNRVIAVELLDSVHAKTDTAENGKIAVNMFHASAPEMYDAILMDLQMPELDGIGAAKQIRAMNHPQAKTIPIIAMTANAYPEDIKACFDAGMNGHLTKPFNPEKLYKTLRELCR